MVSSAAVQGVIFDLDGTLYSLSSRKLLLTLGMWRDLNILRHFSATRSWLRVQEFEGRSEIRRVFFDELASRAQMDSSEVEHWYEERFLGSLTRLLGRLGRIRPGLDGLLLRLRSRGIRLGVISDFGRVTERLEALGIAPDLFDAVSAAEDFGALKPSPRPLLGVAGQWGLDQHQILVVGDRQDLDGASANAAGMEFIGVKENKFLSRGQFLSWNDTLRQLDVLTRSANGQFEGRV